MEKRFFDISALIVLILFFMVFSVFAFPNFINYQGQLTDPSGNPLNGDYALTFMIYGEETEGEALWTEQHTITVANGLYNAELGTVNPFPEDLFETEMLYLEVIIHNEDTGSDETLSPRIPFTSTGFSMKAKDAETVAWSNITGKPATFADDVVYVDSNGNVGIGTSTPNSTFQIIGSISRQGTTLNGTNKDTHVNLGVNSYTYDQYSTVSGGYNNSANGRGSTVSGGESNTASGYDATVSGGGSNIAGNWGSTVSGGGSNTASGWGSTVSGGANNIASGTWSTISGGLLNTASGYCSTTSGGGNNIAAGDYSWAGGHNMQLTEDADRTFAWGYSDSNVSISTTDSFIIYSGNVGIGTKNPNAMLEVDGSVYFEGGNGDVSNDGIMELADHLMAGSYLLGGISLNREQLANADIDGDGRVTWEDVFMIYDFYRGKSKDSLKRQFHSVYGAVSSDTFYVHGNVGVGTMEPGEKLEVDGAVKATAFIGDGSYLTGISSESFARSTSKTVTASYSPEFGDPVLIVDDVFAPEGTGWADPNYAVKLNSAGYDTNLKIDLGSIYDIYRLRVQADDNDDYRVEYSMDASTWNTLYDLPRAVDGGLRTRDSGAFESVKARYLRIYAVSGDDAYSVSEVEVYAYGINIADSGNVGIGTTNPEKPLEVTGSDGDGIVRLSFNGNDRHLSLGGDWPYIDSYGSGARLLLNFNSDQDIDIGNGDLYIVNSTGNLGIGTTVPRQKLEVTGSGDTRIRINSKDTLNNTAALELFNGTIAKSFIYYGATGSRGNWLHLEVPAGQGGISLDTGGYNPRMVIDPSGNIGISTTSPSAKFELDISAGPCGGKLRLFANATGNLGHDFGYDGGDDSHFYFAHFGSESGETRFVWHNEISGRDLMVIKNNGNIGIGTMSPSEKLEVAGTVKASAFVGDGSYLTGISSESFARSTSKIVTANYSPEFGDPGLIADGVFAPEGTGWADPDYAVKLNYAGYETNLKIDLGAIYDIYRLRVQADCNDDYRVEYSMDDSIWNSLYDMPRAADGGLRTRDSGTFASVKARYLRIYVVSGDDAYSVSEVEVYAYGINIADSGNVGIGTTNPEKPLEVTGSDGDGIVRLSFNGNDRYLSLGGDWPYIDSYGIGARLLLNFHSSQDIDMGNGDLYIVNSSGNVGIGTISPEAKLHVYGNMKCENEIRFKNSSDMKGIVWGTVDWRFYHSRIDDYYGQLYIMTDDHFYVSDIDGSNGSPGSVRFYINTDNGNVGIGTTSPDAKLHVEGTIEVDQKIQANDSGGLELATDEGITRLHIADSGNIGIGTTSPGAILHIFNLDAAIPTFRIGNTLHGGLEFTQGSGDLFLGGDNAQTGNFYVKDAQGNIRIAINSDTSSYFNSGNVGIGTTGPNYKLHVIGDIAYTGSIYDVSDIRLKENITSIENAVEKVSSINGIYFNNKGELPEKREVGVIAQKVEEVLPEIVSEDNEGYKSVDYSKLTPLLIEAIKELKAENEELKERILALEAVLQP